MAWENDVFRDDVIYKDIEAYQDYELTYCLSYEMAVRNTEVISLLEEMKNLTTEGEKEYSIMPKTVDASFTMHGEVPGMDSDTLTSLKKRYLEVEEQLRNDFYFSLDDTHLLRNRKAILEARIAEDGPKKSIDEQINDLAKSVGESKNTIYHPIYNTRQPSVPKAVSKVMNYNIDFALPEKEMIAQILQVKKMYDALHPSTALLLEGNDNNEKIYKYRIAYTNKHAKSVELTFPKKTKLQLYADAFYIYDVMSSMEDPTDPELINNIQNALLDYYTEMIISANGLKATFELEMEIYNSITRLDSETIIKYYNAFKRYIEELEYKKLIT